MDSKPSTSKLSRRERLKRRFRGVGDPAPASPVRPESVPASSTTSTSLTRGIDSSMLTAALEKLSKEEQETIQTYRPSTFSVDDALDTVRGAAVTIHHEGEEKRWHWTYRGQQIYLRDHIDKIVRLLDKFKSVGDVIANVDPVHIGLPWAGLRTLLEVAMSGTTQRAAIVTGIELSLLISNRLKVYRDFLVRLTASLATDNFRKALVALYAHVLGFLARAIHVPQKNSAARMLYAAWNPDNLAKFEDECNSLCNKIEIEASNCDREALEQWKKRMDSELKALHQIHKISETLDKIDQRTGLMNLKIAQDATYDSSTEGDLARCLPDTRTDILARIRSWSSGEDGKKIFWLSGKAGTGKSTISRTVAETLQESGLLGASFFFKRGRADRSHAALLFPTIAYQLANLFPDMRKNIIAALDRNPLVGGKHLSTQFDQLLLQPLQNNFQISISPRNVVLVIDALDECDSGDNIKAILYFLAKIDAATSMRLRIFVTSRPELPVELGFKQMAGDLHHDVRLEEVQVLSIARDIRIFYDWKFDKIRKNSLLDFKPLPIEWPEEDSTQELVKLAGQLFVFAFTITQYISEDNARERLNLILEQDRSLLTDLQSTYLPILDQLLTKGNEQQNLMRIASFKAVVGPIVLLKDPLSASSLSMLLPFSIETIDRILRPLHSVLNVPKEDHKLDPDTAITLFHLSFRDFLVDAALQSSSRFWIDEMQTHSMLAIQCVRLLSSDVLKEDICEVRMPGTRRADVTKEHIKHCLPDAVVYACCYWIDHVVSSRKQGTNNDEHVFEFLKKHFLHWIEAMSWLGKAADVILKLEQLLLVVNGDHGGQLLHFLNDANHFALRNRAIIDEAPLQTYLSALVFAPSRSIIRRTFGSDLGKYLDLFPKVPKQWNAERLKLEGHEDAVCAVAISADGKTVASGSWDHTVRLWSTATGEQIQCFQSSGILTEIRYTDDGNVLETDVGHFILDSPSGYDSAKSNSPGMSVVLDPLWVKYNGSDLLWLPHEYRGVRWAAHSTLLVIGHFSGAMSFFSFKPWNGDDV